MLYMATMMIDFAVVSGNRVEGRVDVVMGDQLMFAVEDCFWSFGQRSGRGRSEAGRNSTGALGVLVARDHPQHEPPAF